MPPACTENAARADARIDPDDPVGQAREALHLAADQQRVAALPAVGEDHDHGAACHAAAPVAVVELLQRVADPGPARPVRRRGGGALDRALGMARGQRARQAGQARGEDERLGVRAAAGGAGQELQVGAGVGLHRARDVAQHHEPAADDAPPPAREADRLAPGAHAGPQGPPHVDALAVAPALVAARAPQRGRELAGATSAGRAARARAARARRSACRPAAPRRSPSPAERRPPAPSSSSPPARRADDATRPRRRRSGRSRGRRRPLVGRRGAARRAASGARRGAGAPKIEKKTASKAATCARSDTNTARAVQYSRRRLTGRTSVSARAKSAGRSGVIGTPASCRRRLSAPASGGRSSSTVSSPKLSHRCARAARGRPRGSPPGPRRT